MGARYAALAAIALLAFPPRGVEAARWTFSESISLSEAYTDNVYLSDDNREDAWATIISPNFRLSGEGARVQVDLVAALQIVAPSDQNFYPQLRASVSSELVKQRFYLDAYARATQRTIDPTRPAGTPIHRTDNITTTYAVGINPRWLERFGSLADLRMDYLYEHEFYTGSRLSDRDTNSFHFDLTSGRLFGRSNWAVSGAYRRYTYEDSARSDATFKSLDFRLGYDLTRSLSPYLSWGREWNTYQNRGGRTGGDKWLVGAVWAPNARIHLDAGYGYRFFGNYPFVDLVYRHRRSTLRLSYTQDLYSGYLPLDEDAILPYTDLAGNPVDPFADGPGAFYTPEYLETYDTGAYVNEVFTADYLLHGRRTSFGITARYSDKMYEYGDRELLEWRLGLRLSRTLGRNLSVDARASWRRTDETGGEPLPGDFRSDTWNLGFGVNRTLGRHTRLRLSYTHSRRDSNRPGDDYTENRVALVLTTSMVGLARHAGY